MIIKILVGFLSGMTASMGLGGGFILVIYLTTILEINQIDAQGMNIMFFIPIAIISIFFHIKNKLIDKKPLLFSIISGIFGVLIGISTTFLFKVEFLSKLFSIMLFIFGLRELFHKKQ